MAKKPQSDDTSISDVAKAGGQVAKTAAKVVAGAAVAATTAVLDNMSRALRSGQQTGETGQEAPQESDSAKVPGRKRSAAKKKKARRSAPKKKGAMKASKKKARRRR